LPKVDAKYMARAKRAVRREFPEMAGAEPTVTTRKGHSKSTSGTGTGYVLTFKKQVQLPGGKSMARTVRVTMDPAGKIVKLSSSK
jgi:hypothetical protein